MAFPVEVSVKIDSTRMLRKLQAIYDGMMQLPERRRANIEQIVRSGLRDNFVRLSMGGAIETASGGTLAWSTERHPITSAARRRLGLDAVYPLLHFTGRLEEGLFGGDFTFGGGGSATGGFRSGTRQIRYAPGADVAELVRVHQRGLEPLSDGSPGQDAKARAIGRVMPRPMLVWSKGMAEGVVREGRSLLGDLKRR